MTDSDPHAEARIERGGVPLSTAEGAVVALHGRGATAVSILQLVAEGDRTDNAVAYLAPQAVGNTWYPYSFLEPQSRNEPHLNSALDAVDRTVSEAVTAVGAEQVIIVGFSQGACLASEFAARDARRYGALVAFSGGLIGDRIVSDRYGGSFDGMPVYLGCSDIDPHIPVERVYETEDVLDDLDAAVETEIFEGMGHTVNETELAALASHIDGIVSSS